MSEETQKWKNEVRAELELMWGSQSASNSRIEEIGQSMKQCARRLDEQATKIDEHGQQIAEQSERIAEQGERIAEQGERIAEQGERIVEQGRQIVEQGQRIADQGKMIALQSTVIADSLRHSAGLADQLVESGREYAGRLRQLDSKLVKYLDAVERSSERRFDDLEARVARLEQRSDPAA